MPRRAAPPALAIAAALLLNLTACGDERLTTAELQARATAICAQAAAATDRIAVPNTPAQGERFLREGLAQLRPAVAQLGGLQAPERLRARDARALRLARREVALIAAHARAIAHGDDVIDTYRRLDAALEPLVREENAAWRGLGVPACVRR
jgi:hypothetical protein